MARRRKGRGHPEYFTRAQNQVLHEALHELDDAMASQDELAKALGVVQQTASRLLRDGRFSTGPATALVRRLGYAGLDAFFAKKGVALAPTG